MRQALSWPWRGGEFKSPAVESGPERCSLGAQPPPTECDFEGPRSKISAMGPESLATALRAIMVSGPSTVYHLVFTPILSFPYSNPTEEFSSTWRWKLHNRPPHKQVPLVQTIDDTCNDITGGDQCQAWICHTRRKFPRCLTNENFHYDVNENPWPNPQDRVDKNTLSSEEHPSWHFNVGQL